MPAKGWKTVNVREAVYTKLEKKAKALDQAAQGVCLMAEADWRHARDEQELDIMDRFVGGDLFVDVGAHAGRWTLRLARLFEQAIAYEPNTEAYVKLIENVVSEKLDNVQIVKAAISSRNGQRTLCTLDGTPSVSTFYPQFSSRKVSSRERVNTMTLDTALAGRDPTLIKVDVEGSEADVLLGAIRVLQLAKPALCVETHSKALYERCSGILKGYGLPFETVERKYEDGGKPKKYIVRWTQG